MLVNRPFMSDANRKDIPCPGDEGYVDLLDEDKPLAGQKWTCLSFVSPEKVIQHKELFYFDEFAKQWELSKSMEKFTKFLAFISHKYHLPLESLNEDLQEFSEAEKGSLFQNSLTLKDEYKTFVDNNEEKLQGMYDEANHFTTSTRGLKVRGCFPSQKEAELRAKTLRAVDPNHDIMVGPVGIWLPFDPEAYKTGKTEYLEAELNQLMQEKKKNESKANDEFVQRVREAKEQAMKDNVEKATASGAKLTQRLDKGGNLVSVSDVSTFEDQFDGKEDVSAQEVRDKLFNSDNIPTSHAAGRTVIDIGNDADGVQEAKSEDAGDGGEAKDAKSMLGTDPATYTPLDLPQTEEPKPDIEEPKPDAEEPKPDIEEHKPAAEEPKPDIEEPKPDAEEPKPDIEEPKPDAEEPKPDIEEPKPDAEEPKVDAEEPKPDASIADFEATCEW